MVLFLQWPDASRILDDSYSIVLIDSIALGVVRMYLGGLAVYYTDEPLVACAVEESIQLEREASSK